MENQLYDLDFSDEAENSGIVSKDIEQYKGQNKRTDRVAIIYRRKEVSADYTPTESCQKQIDAGDCEIVERDGKKL